MKGKGEPDFEADWAVGEVKTREEFPKWLTEAVSQVVSYARRGKLPMLCLHEKGKHNFLVVIRSDHFRAWFGEMWEKQDDE